MKKILLMLLAVTLMVVSSCHRDDDCVTTTLEPLFYKAMPGSSERFGGQLSIYGLDYVDPLDIDVNYYRIDFKNADVIYIPWNEFMILRDPTFKDRLAFEIIGPSVTAYTGRPVSHIRTITVQCKIRPHDYLTELITKKF